MNKKGLSLKLDSKVSVEADLEVLKQGFIEPLKSYGEIPAIAGEITIKADGVLIDVKVNKLNIDSSVKTLTLGNNGEFKELNSESEDFKITGNIPLSDQKKLIFIEEKKITQTEAKSDDTAGISFEHTVSSFYMGRYEVTYELWHEVLSWAKGKGYNIINEGKEGVKGIIGAEPVSKIEPVTNINWYDAVVWCNAYSEMEILTPVYKISGTAIKDSTPNENITCDWNAGGYRLPTEGEWYAAALANGAYNRVSGSGETDNAGDYGWYKENSSGNTSIAGAKKPNSYGLYDMSGNVSEWCWDWFGEYPNESITNYKGLESGNYKVRKGGSWNTSVSYLYPGLSDVSSPNYRSSEIGFRVAKTCITEKGR